jgi:hypothetical protein
MHSPPLLHTPQRRSHTHTGLAGRLLTATLGSYLLCTALLANTPAGPAGQSDVRLGLLPFIACTGMVFWTFQARQLWHVWAGLLAIALAVLLPLLSA